MDVFGAKTTLELLAMTYRTLLCFSSSAHHRLTVLNRTFLLQRSVIWKAERVCVLTQSCHFLAEHFLSARFPTKVQLSAPADVRLEPGAAFSC